MKRFLLAFVAVFALIGEAHAGYDHSTQNAENATPATASALDSECMVLAYDVTNEDGIFISCDDIGGLGDADATKAEINRATDDSARVNTITADTTLACATHGTGQLNYVSAASGTVNVTLTMPAATGSGCQFWVGWSAAPNSGAGETGDVIQVTGNDSFNGTFMMAQDGGNTAVFFETASDTDKLTFTSAKGAAVANVYVSFTDYASDKYQIGPNALIGTGTEASPGATGQRS